jgi:hypothetical protein
MSASSEHAGKKPTMSSSWVWPPKTMPPTFWWLVVVVTVAVISWMIGAGYDPPAFWWLALAAGTGLTGWLFGYWHGRATGYTDRFDEESRRRTGRVAA